MTTRIARLSIIVASSLAVAIPAGAQPRSGDASPPPRIDRPTPDDAEALGADAQDTGGVYDPADRRDPFRALTGATANDKGREHLAHALRGLLLSEVRLTSIVETPHGSIATFEGGPSKEGYFARVGDELWDGRVIDIDYATKTVVVRQKVDDPNAIKNFRDQVVSFSGEPPP